MIHYTGFYFCTQSNWNHDFFYARNLVAIEDNSEDFKILLDKLPLHPEGEHESWKSYYQLKPEVLSWLEENVKDEDKITKGWCCGDKEYNSRLGEYFSLFFYRRKDALNFIKTWSVHKKPTETYNQNTYVRKVLDKETNTLKIVKR